MLVAETESKMFVEFRLKAQEEMKRAQLAAVIPR
jgi:hypothetical protein